MVFEQVYTLFTVLTHRNTNVYMCSNSLEQVSAPFTTNHILPLCFSVKLSLQIPLVWT